jgi:UDP-N-acetylmuramoyl-L-alanyl-D-glutamate--2,6-diaminopimelate ligase
VLTSDNPRTEEPDEIIKDMAAGLDPLALAKTLQISNRKEAIKLACTLAQTGDIILIAGKGHEKYQDIKGVKHPFDDLETVETTFKLLNK